MTWLNVFIIIFMLAILFSLFRGLFHLGKGNPESSKKLLKSLQWRIALSSILFLVIIGLHYFGVINLRSSILPL